MRHPDAPTDEDVRRDLLEQLVQAREALQVNEKLISKKILLSLSMSLCDLINNLEFDEAQHYAVINCARDVIDALTFTHRCDEKQCDYYLDYLAKGSAELTHEGYHAAV